VQELEAKNREYEAERMKASVEIQTVARKVNDENKLLRSENQALKDENAQLREVLSSLGVSEADLNRQLSHSRISSRINSSSQTPCPTQTIGLSIART
jgi:hypothetical protein